MMDFLATRLTFFTTLKILQCLHNIIRCTNVLVCIMIRLQECTDSIDKQIGIVFVQDSCAVYGKNLESLEKNKECYVLEANSLSAF